MAPFEIKYSQSSRRIASASNSHRPSIRRKSLPGNSATHPPARYSPPQFVPVADSLRRFPAIPITAPAGRAALDRNGPPPPAPPPDEIEILCCWGNKPARFDNPSAPPPNRRPATVLRPRQTTDRPAHALSCGTSVKPTP